MAVRVLTATTLAQAFLEACERWPNRVALSSNQEQLTYGELREAANALAVGYRDLGIGPGARVVCQLPNCKYHVVSMAAVWLSGAVHVGASPDLTLPELAWLVNRAAPSAVVMAPLRDGRDPLAAARAVRGSDGAPTVILAGNGTAADGFLSLQELLSTDAASTPISFPGAEDVAAIFFTSGTTGRPKGPLGFHGPLAKVWGWFGKALGCGPGDVHLGHLPMAYGFGMMMASISLFTGGKLVLMPRFSVSEALALIEEEEVSVLNGTPTHYKLVLDRLTSEHRNVSTLRTGVASAASFTPLLLTRVLDELQMVPLLLYGSSELLYVCTSSPSDLRRGSVGRPADGQVAVVGPDRKPVGPDRLGEIAFRVEWPIRYWREPEAARESGEWYYTGDIGRLDGDGRLYVVGRVKHQINRGGQKVDPGQVELELNGIPGVADQAVVGLPDPVLGEVVCACIVPAGDAPPTLERLRSALSPSLASYKLPEELCLLDEIPRNRNGKVDHAALQRAAMASDRRERLRRR